jgi:hypothetical protein
MLVMVNDDGKLEMEMLFKASAYILGATGLSTVYKDVRLLMVAVAQERK